MRLAKRNYMKDATDKTTEKLRGEARKSKEFKDFEKALQKAITDASNVGQYSVTFDFTPYKEILPQRDDTEEQIQKNRTIASFILDAVLNDLKRRKYTYSVSGDELKVSWD